MLRERWDRTGIDDDEGAVAAMFAVCIVLFVGLLALVADYGLVLAARTQLRTSADAGALAAAQDLLAPDGDPVGEGIRLARSNAPAHGGVTDSGDVRLGSWNPLAGSFEAGRRPYDAVAVTATRSIDRGNAVELVFGPFLGRQTADVSQTAVAAIAPATAGDVIPVSLRSPGFAPVDPDIVEDSPGKAGPSTPSNGVAFSPGEEVVLFTFGKGKQSPVHLVLDVPGSDPGAVLGGSAPPVAVAVGETYRVVGEGTGQGGLGGDLARRLDRPVADPARHILVPVLEEISGSRGAQDRLSGKVRVGDLTAVYVDRVERREVADPDDPADSIEIEVVVGVVEQVVGGRGGGGPPSGVGGGLVVSVRLVK